MEAIGAVASITGVIGCVSQIAIGCKAIKDAIGDIKDAPEEIWRISEYIDSMKGASEDALKLHEEIKQYLAPGEVLEVSVEDRFKAVQTLEKELLNSIKLFKDTALNDTQAVSKKQRWRSILHRLKWLAKKDDTEELLVWLDRMKGQVILVQQKMASWDSSNEQHAMLKDLGASVDVLRASQHDNEQRTRTVLDCVQQTSNIVRYIPSTEAIGTSTAAKVCEDLRPTLETLQATSANLLELASGQSMMELTPMIEFIIAKHVEQVLERHRSEIPQIQPTNHQDLRIITQARNPSVTSELDELLQEAPEASQSLSEPSHVIHTSRFRESSHQAPSKNGIRGFKFHYLLVPFSWLYQKISIFKTYEDKSPFAEDYARGYEQFVFDTNYPQGWAKATAFFISNASSTNAQGFSYIHARTIIRLQNNIQHLEDELKRLDEADMVADTEESIQRLRGSTYGRHINSAQDEVLEKCKLKINEYVDLCEKFSRMRALGSTLR